MKHRTSLVLLVTLVPLWASCTSPSRKQDRALSAAVHSDKPPKDSPAKAKESDLDEYDAVAIADPLERLNRGTFWVNDWVYTIVLRPVSKGYEIVVPRPM
ncbi:MAG TPA: MlaA family lipoprotein, partial [Terrimicrobiaceae bacterium]